MNFKFLLFILGLSLVSVAQKNWHFDFSKIDTVSTWKYSFSYCPYSSITNIHCEECLEREIKVEKIDCDSEKQTCTIITKTNQSNLTSEILDTVFYNTSSDSLYAKTDGKITPFYSADHRFWTIRDTIIVETNDTLLVEDCSLGDNQELRIFSKVYGTLYIAKKFHGHGFNESSAYLLSKHNGISVIEDVKKVVEHIFQPFYWSPCPAANTVKSVPTNYHQMKRKSEFYNILGKKVTLTKQKKGIFFFVQTYDDGRVVHRIYNYNN